MMVDDFFRGSVGWRGRWAREPGEVRTFAEPLVLSGGQIAAASLKCGIGVTDLGTANVGNWTTNANIAAFASFAKT
ncbi:hypothetical protein T281_04485 [Rhodomicrobium udaipurense JA643]|nr:hypothetical protein T281_04485 [Rhodomicrobium udaipurense JA643]